MEIPESRVTYIAQTNYRNVTRPFGVKQADRRAHMYIIGKTGTGKSTLLESMIRQDMANGQGVALLDPHGDLVESALRNVPEARRDDLIYFNVPDTRNILNFNPLQSVPIERRALAASGLLDAFKKIWADSWGPRLEHILRNAFLALLNQRETVLADVLRLLDDRSFRRGVVARVYSLQVRDFGSGNMKAIRRVLERKPSLRPKQSGRVPGASASQQDTWKDEELFRSQARNGRAKDPARESRQGKDRGRRSDASRSSARDVSRAELAERERKDFFLYLDKFQNFTTLSLVNMLSELRKYRVGLSLTHQYLAQIDPQVRESILGNAGTIISFRLGLSDADILEKEFHPEFSTQDLINLPNYTIYLKLMIDGVMSRSFSAERMLG